LVARNGLCLERVEIALHLLHDGVPFSARLRDITQAGRDMRDALGRGRGFCAKRGESGNNFGDARFLPRRRCFERSERHFRPLVTVLGLRAQFGQRHVARFACTFESRNST
jgi:hypothetical protein